MFDRAGIRDDRIRSLAMRLKRDQLSSDDFEIELDALTKLEKTILVEFLAELAHGYELPNSL